MTPPIPPPGPALVGTVEIVGIGSHPSNALMVVLVLAPTLNTSIYDPVVNTFIAVLPLQLRPISAHSFQRPDGNSHYFGRYFFTSIYDPSQHSPAGLLFSAVMLLIPNLSNAGR